MKISKSKVKEVLMQLGGFGGKSSSAVRARTACAAYLRAFTPMSVTEIAAFMGFRSHSNTVAVLKRFENNIAEHLDIVSVFVEKCGTSGHLVPNHWVLSAPKNDWLKHDENVKFLKKLMTSDTDLTQIESSGTMDAISRLNEINRMISYKLAEAVILKEKGKDE